MERLGKGEFSFGALLFCLSGYRSLARMFVISLMLTFTGQPVKHGTFVCSLLKIVDIVIIPFSC